MLGDRYQLRSTTAQRFSQHMATVSEGSLLKSILRYGPELNEKSFASIMGRGPNRWAFEDDKLFASRLAAVREMIGPTTTSYAYDLNSNNNDALKSFYDDILTNPVNMTGNPALSMPIGFSVNNLPIGLQIIGNKYDEKTIYKLASYIEKELDLNLIPGGFYEN